MWTDTCKEKGGNEFIGGVVYYGDADINVLVSNFESEADGH